MNDKDAYYFSHDSNARNDDKLLAVRMRLGAEGYGIFFMILERLRDDAEYMSVKDYNVLAFDFRVSADKVKSVVEDFGLFVFTEDGKHFYSERMMKNMEKKNEKSLKAKKAAGVRWSKSNNNKENDTVEMQTQCKRNANAMPLKERKVKESKGKESKEVEEKKNNDNNFELIETLKTKYLNNEKLINAVLSVKKNRFKNKDEISKRLEQFNNELKSKSIFQKPWNDYTSHFLNWHRKTVGQNNDANQQSRQRIPIG